MSSTTTTTTKHTTEPYELIYWPGLPGRGEHIRLLFEEANTAYTDTARAPDAVDQLLALVDPSSRSSPGPADDGDHTPACAPPLLRRGALVLSQTTNILLYLGPRLGLAPPLENSDDGGGGLYVVNGLALTALDGLSNEVHDVHHPIATRCVSSIEVDGNFPI